MIKTSNADRLVENLEILADDNCYPIESDKDYIALCNMIEEDEDWVDRKEFMNYYNSLKYNISNF